MNKCMQSCVDLIDDKQSTLMLIKDLVRALWRLSLVPFEPTCFGRHKR